MNVGYQNEVDKLVSNTIKARCKYICMDRVCVGQLCHGPSLQWSEVAKGRDVQFV